MIILSQRICAIIDSMIGEAGLTADMNSHRVISSGNATAVTNERLVRAKQFGKELSGRINQNGSFTRKELGEYFPTYFIAQDFDTRDIENLDATLVAQRLDLSSDGALNVMEQACVRVAVKAAILGQRKFSHRRVPAEGRSEVINSELYQAYQKELGAFAGTTLAILKDNPELRFAALKLLADNKIVNPAAAQLISPIQLEGLITEQFIEAQKRPQEKLHAIGTVDSSDVPKLIV